MVNLHRIGGFIKITVADWQYGDTGYRQTNGIHGRIPNQKNKGLSPFAKKNIDDPKDFGENILWADYDLLGRSAPRYTVTKLQSNTAF